MKDEIKVGDRVKRKPINKFKRLSHVHGIVIKKIGIERNLIKWNERVKGRKYQSCTIVNDKFLIKIHKRNMATFYKKTKRRESECKLELIGFSGHLPEERSKSKERSIGMVFRDEKGDTIKITLYEKEIDFLNESLEIEGL